MFRHWDVHRLSGVEFFIPTCFIGIVCLIVCLFTDNVALAVSGLALLVIACSTSSEYTNSCSYGHRQGEVEIFNSPSFRICNLFPDPVRLSHVTYQTLVVTMNTINTTIQ